MKLIDVSCERCNANMNITSQYSDKLNDMLEMFKHKQDYPLIITCPACNGEFVVLIECNVDEYVQISQTQISMLCNSGAVAIGDNATAIGKNGVNIGGSVVGNIVISGNFVGHDKTVVYTNNEKTIVHNGDTILDGKNGDSEITINGKKY